MSVCCGVVKHQTHMHRLIFFFILFFSLLFSRSRNSLFQAPFIQFSNLKMKGFVSFQNIPQRAVTLVTPVTTTATQSEVKREEKRAKKHPPPPPPQQQQQQQQRQPSPLALLPRRHVTPLTINLTFERMQAHKCTRVELFSVGGARTCDVCSCSVVRVLKR